MAKGKIRGSIWLDSLFATFFIYAFMFVVANISAFKIFDAFDTVGEALQDMEITDIAFSQFGQPLPPDTNIVLVNIGYLPRAGIAEQIRIIDKYRPKVIGIDSFFKGRKQDTLGDMSLAAAIAEASAEVVMVTRIQQSDSLSKIHLGEEIYDVIYTSDSLFRQGAHLAMANLDTEASSQEDIKICRAFPPQRILTDGQIQLAFGAKLAEIYDPESIEPLLKRNNEFELINYRGDFANFLDNDILSSDEEQLKNKLRKFSTRFYALDYYQVLNEDFASGLIKDKIVIFGFLGSEFGSLDWEDKFFTPLNLKIAGRANPDMYGPVIHANILSMILNGDYVDTLSDTTANIVGVLLCFLNVLLFSLIYRKLGVWYDGLSKLIQLIEVILILFLIIQLFSRYSFKLELTIGLFAVALAGDLLEIYYGVIRNLFSREKRRQLFRLKRSSSK